MGVPQRAIVEKLRMGVDIGDRYGFQFSGQRLQPVGRRWRTPYLESANGMPQAPASRCRKSSQSRPFRASTSATSNHRFVVGDSDCNLERSKPRFDMIVQNSGKPDFFAFW